MSDSLQTMDCLTNHSPFSFPIPYAGDFLGFFILPKSFSFFFSGEKFHKSEGPNMGELISSVLNVLFEVLQGKWIEMFTRQLRNWLRGGLGDGNRFWNHMYG